MAKFGEADADGDGVRDEDMKGIGVTDGDDGIMADSMDGIMGSQDGIMNSIEGSVEVYISISMFMDGCG